MPAKTALTVDKWLEKITAILPGWFFRDVESSVLRSHLLGLATVFHEIENILYDHVNQTFIGRASDEFLEVHAAERLIPNLDYIEDGRRRQIQDLTSKVDLDGLRQAVADVLIDPTVEVEDGYSTGTTVLTADYNDVPENVVDWATIPNFFSVVIGAQILPSYSFCDRAAYSDRESYVSVAITGSSPITLRAKNVVDHYKSAGTRYRIFQRT